MQRYFWLSLSQFDETEVYRSANSCETFKTASLTNLSFSVDQNHSVSKFRPTERCRIPCLGRRATPSRPIRNWGSPGPTQYLILPTKPRRPVVFETSSFFCVTVVASSLDSVLDSYIRKIHCRSRLAHESQPAICLHDEQFMDTCVAASKRIFNVAWERACSLRN